VPPFENADAAFAAGAPFLRLLEPPLLLFLLAFLTLGGATGNGHSLHAQFFGLGFVGGGEESRVGKRQIRNSTHQLLVFFDRRRQQIGVAGALVEDFAVNDDLIFRFLDFDDLAELGRLTGLAFSNDFRVRLKHAEDFVFSRACCLPARAPAPAASAAVRAEAFRRVAFWLSVNTARCSFRLCM